MRADPVAHQQFQQNSSDGFRLLNTFHAPNTLPLLYRCNLVSSSLPLCEVWLLLAPFSAKETEAVKLRGLPKVMCLVREGFSRGLAGPRAQALSSV